MVPYHDSPLPLKSRVFVCVERMHLIPTHATILLWLYVLGLVASGSGAWPWNSGGGAITCNANSSTSSSSSTSSRNTSRNASSSREILAQFIQEQQPAIRIDNFKVQGWRWHTMSLLREVRRLEAAAAHNQHHRNRTVDLNDAVGYIVDFNLHGLLKIQNELFFPWVKTQIRQRTKANENEEKIAQAFGHVVDDLQVRGNQCRQLGQRLKRIAEQSSSSSGNHEDDMQRVARQLSIASAEMLEIEDNLLVPVVAHFIPPGEQSAFNNRVIRTLGLLDSRLHLVGMHQAVMEMEGNNKHEMQTFEHTIPYIPRTLIPRWKRTLYDPKVAVLEGH